MRVLKKPSVIEIREVSEGAFVRKPRVTLNVVRTRSLLTKRVRLRRRGIAIELL